MARKNDFQSFEHMIDSIGAADTEEVLHEELNDNLHVDESYRDDEASIIDEMEFSEIDDRPALSEREATYFRSIDASLPLLRNLRDSFIENCVDIGKLGIVLYKYESINTLDQSSYDECVRALVQHSFSAQKNVSALGELSPVIFQIGTVFLMNLKEKKSILSESVRSSQKTERFNWHPKFQFISRTFSGTSPFKTHQVVCLQFGEQSPTHIQRAIYWVLKNVLVTILDEPTGHQRYAIRANGGRNAKTKYLDLPEDVKRFTEDFCLESFGYPRSLRFPSYSLESLMADSPELATKLGSDENQRKQSFRKLLKDVQLFHHIIFTKFQRIFSDFRNHRVKEIACNVAHGMVTKREFVADSYPEQPVNSLKPPSAQRLDHECSASPRQIDDFEDSSGDGHDLQ